MNFSCSTIDATRYGQLPKYSLIEEIVSEAFMPVAYGGGIKSPSDAERLFRCGLEKIVLSSSLFDSTTLVHKLANRYGSQSIVACLDVRKDWFGRYRLTAVSGSIRKSLNRAIGPAN